MGKYVSLADVSLGIKVAFLLETGGAILWQSALSSNLPLRVELRQIIS